MEQEQKHGPEHKMCDWCGNEYGRKYSWLRLVVAILIGLFIFSAGYHLGELNVLVHSQYGSQMSQGHWQGRIMGSRGDMMNQEYGTTTILIPSADATPATTAPAAPRP
ncbi:MAG: hypothetical protein JWL92_506 [Candidatus Nomurabacteria bacterium]|nr:hypothetical protein [Candidatus Nomurabacteria bacterium]